MVKKKTYKKRMTKKVWNICHFCSGEIKSTDHHVLIGTYNRPTKPNDEAYFHFQCFIDFMNQAVEKRARKMTADMQKKAMELLDSPLLKGILSGVKGMPQIMSMISTPLDDKKLDGLKILIKDIEKNKTKVNKNGKTKTRGRPKTKKDKRRK